MREEHEECGLRVKHNRHNRQSAECRCQCLGASARQRVRGTSFPASAMVMTEAPMTTQEQRTSWRRTRGTRGSELGARAEQDREQGAQG